MKTQSRLVLLAAALVSTTALALPSRATLTGDVQTRTETVKYKPTEAATPEGAAVLYAKLQEAAERVCSHEGFGSSGDSADLSSCVADALNTAVRRVGIPMVSAVHLQAGRPATIAAN